MPQSLRILGPPIPETIASWPGAALGCARCPYQKPSRVTLCQSGRPNNQQARPSQCLMSSLLPEIVSVGSGDAPPIKKSAHRIDACVYLMPVPLVQRATRVQYLLSSLFSSMAPAGSRVPHGLIKAPLESVLASTRPIPYISRGTLWFIKAPLIQCLIVYQT